MSTKNKLSSAQITNPMSCAGYNIRRATRAITSLYGGVLKVAGLKSTQFTLLAGINARGGTPLSELADIMAMDRTTLTRNMSYLIKQGFIETLSGEDKRVKIIHLTKKGKVKLDEAFPIWADIQTRFVKRLGQDKFEQLLDLLKEVEDVAG